MLAVILWRVLKTTEAWVTFSEILISLVWNGTSVLGILKTPQVESCSDILDIQQPPCPIKVSSPGRTKEVQRPKAQLQPHLQFQSSAT